MKKLTYLICLIFLTSCEVEYALLDGSIDADSFSVDIFEERAANAPAGYGIAFTEFLRDFVVSRSKLKLVKEEADIEISGKVTNYYTSPLSVQSDEQAAQTRLTVSMEVSVVNNRNEKQSFKQSFSQFADFDASLDLSTEEDVLLEEINDKLAQDILNKLSSNW